jgi:hypothetical protein
VSGAVREQSFLSFNVWCSTFDAWLDQWIGTNARLIVAVLKTGNSQRLVEEARYDEEA